MQVLERPYGVLHVKTEGPEAGPAVVFANSLGTDLRLWDPVLPLLPLGLRYIRYDKRGHGLSSGGEGGDWLADHVDDALAVIEAFAAGPVVFVGLSIGGLIGQALASRRPDLLRALVLSNTAVRLGTRESWDQRIAAVRAGGMAAIADGVMPRWFSAEFRQGPTLALWRNMLLGCSVEGYTAACAALAGADQTRETAGLDLPVLVIAGDEDGASPSAQVRATADLIPGARFHEIAGAGHLPCVDQPQSWAALVAPFLEVHRHD